MIAPQGTPTNKNCQPLAREAEYVTNSLPQSGLIDGNLIRSESITLAGYVTDSNLTRSESITLAASILTESLTRSEAASFVNT